MSASIFSRKRRLSRCLGFCNAVLDAWTADHGASKAAALAFYTIFSIAPLLLIVTTLIGFFFDSAATIDEITRQARQLVGDTGASVLREMLLSAGSEHDAGISAIFASVILAIGATSAFAELKNSLDDIWRAPTTAPRGWWDTLHSRVLSFGLVLALAFLMIISLTIDALLTLTSDRMLARLGIEQTDVARIAGVGITMGIVLVLFTLIYRLLPSIRVSWRNAACAGGLTTTLFMIGRVFIGFYLGSMASTSVYGAAASLAVLLLWIYYSSVIFFMSAEIARFWLGIADEAGKNEAELNPGRRK